MDNLGRLGANGEDAVDQLAIQAVMGVRMPDHAYSVCILRRAEGAVVDSGLMLEKRVVSLEKKKELLVITFNRSGTNHVRMAILLAGS